MNVGTMLQKKACLAVLVASAGYLGSVSKLEAGVYNCCGNTTCAVVDRFKACNSSAGVCASGSSENTCCTNACAN